MKKVILSAFIIISFITYSLNERLKGTNIPFSSVPTVYPKTGSQTQNQNTLKDGHYTGASADAYYGNVQVQVTIQGGRIADVTFLDYPHDRQTSMMINMQAMPQLKMEAIQAQNANVDIVTGATQTSLAFIQSLQSALNQAS